MKTIIKISKSSSLRNYSGIRVESFKLCGLIFLPSYSYAYPVELCYKLGVAFALFAEQVEFLLFVAGKWERFVE